MLQPNKALRSRLGTLSVSLFLTLTLSLGVLADTRIRVVTGNISSGNDQSYDPGHGIRIFRGLKPDVALIQEFNFGDNSTRAIRSFVDTAFGKEFHYFRERAGE